MEKASLNPMFQRETSKEEYYARAPRAPSTAPPSDDDETSHEEFDRIRLAAAKRKEALHMLPRPMSNENRVAEDSQKSNLKFVTRKGKTRSKSFLRTLRSKEILN